MAPTKGEQVREANKQKIRLANAEKSAEALFRTLLKIKSAGLTNQDSVGKVEGCEGDTLGEQLDYAGGLWLHYLEASHKASLAAHLSIYEPDNSDELDQSSSTSDSDEYSPKSDLNKSSSTSQE